MVGDFEFLGFTETLIRVLSAAACGFLLGWERESQDKPAGLRTMMLVAVGSAVATMTALNLFHDVINHSPNDRTLNADPIRIVSGVIGGLGFLGAGAIIQSRGRVHGMTTAATIWMVGGIGVTCGMAYYQMAITSTAAAVFILVLLGRFERSRLAPKSLRKEKEKMEIVSSDDQTRAGE
jgi:putative Mg2+ transporter-C (MgtC) family protein